MIAMRRPDRACKRPRGLYAVLAALSEDEDIAPAAVPAQQHRRKRDRQQEPDTAITVAPADLPTDPAATQQPAIPLDEAPAILLTSAANDSSVTPVSAATSCLHDLGTQTSSAVASGPRRKKSKAVQVTTAHLTAQPEQQRRQRLALPLREKRKPESQPAFNAERRSTRQRFTTMVFDPSDPTAIAGYVHLRGASPDTQSGLPFDTG